MKTPGSASTLLILMWMALVVAIFVIVTVPSEGRLTTVLPEFFWRLREMIYPLFHSPSVL